MDERQFLAVISGEQSGVTPSLLRGALTLAAQAYSVGIAVRNAAFNHGWSRIHRVETPVISVGNLTTGGTGKTPLVAWLLNMLKERGRRPGLLSRGYRRMVTGENDEARVVARLCPNVPHVQQRDRVVGARRLSNPRASMPGCPIDVIVLDDGFQHRRLHRDLDIVLIDALQPWGLGRMLPRGLLREPPSALKRADIVLLTRADLVDLEVLAELRCEIGRVRGIDCDGEIAFRATRLVNPSGQSRSLAELSSLRVAAFCGIGNPLGFLEMLRSLGVLAVSRVFPDHHSYTTSDWNELLQWGDLHSADLLVTTLKDLVKLPPDHPAAHRVWAVDIGVQWLRGESMVFERVASAIGLARQRTAA